MALCNKCGKEMTNSVNNTYHFLVGDVCKNCKKKVGNILEPFVVRVKDKAPNLMQDMAILVSNYKTDNAKVKFVGLDKTGYVLIYHMMSREGNRIVAKVRPILTSGDRINVKYYYIDGGIELNYYNNGKVDILKNYKKDNSKLGDFQDFKCN